MFFYSQIKAFFVLQLFRTLCIDTFCIETKDRKKINFSQNSWCNPFVKMQILSFYNLCFYSLKRLPFFLELHKTLFIALFCINRKDGKTFNFLTKAMD